MGSIKPGDFREGMTLDATVQEYHTALRQGAFIGVFTGAGPDECRTDRWRER
jgi:hypothetical protein